MPFAFIDESGSPSPFGAGRYLAVAVLVVENVRPIEFMVRAVRRRLSRQSATAELKAARSDSRVVRSMLNSLSNIDCQVYGAVLDKRGMRTEDAEAHYRMTMATAIAHAVQDHPRLSVVLDKRYTHHEQQRALEVSIREAIADVIGQVVTIEQRDSQGEPGLQAVDFVAWALRQEAEGASQWFDIVRTRVLRIEQIEGKRRAAPPGGR